LQNIYQLGGSAVTLLILLIFTLSVPKLAWLEVVLVDWKVVLVSCQAVASRDALLLPISQVCRMLESGHQAVICRWVEYVKEALGLLGLGLL
jgi:hypothetical protein